MPSNNHPNKSGGRPRKHSTTVAAVEAKKQSNRRRYLRGLQAQGPADFIAFKPQLHANIPADTPIEVGLCISHDVQIPLDPNADA